MAFSTVPTGDKVPVAVKSTTLGGARTKFGGPFEPLGGAPVKLGAPLPQFAQPGTERALFEYAEAHGREIRFKPIENVTPLSGGFDFFTGGGDSPGGDGGPAPGGDSDGAGSGDGGGGGDGGGAGDGSAGTGVGADGGSSPF